MSDTHTHTTGQDAVIFYGKFLTGDNFNLDDPYRKAMYENLYNYFAASPKTTLNPDKGILMIGNLGVGKSICMRVMNHLFKAFKYAHAKRKIERVFKEFGEVEAMREYGSDYRFSLMIDDLGSEEDFHLVYGNRISLLGQILLERYDLFQQNPKFKTHATTNLTTPQLADRYGQRNYDRFKEMFNVITWEGGSLRK